MAETSRGLAPSEWLVGQNAKHFDRLLPLVVDFFKNLLYRCLANNKNNQLKQPSIIKFNKKISITKKHKEEY